MRRRFPSVSTLEFRCCRIIPSVNHKLTFDERIGTMILCREVIGQFHCMLLLSSKTAKTEAVVVKPVKRKTSEFIWFKLTSTRDFNRENFSSLSAALPYDPFRSMANNWQQYCKLTIRMHRLSHRAWIRCHLILLKFFVSLFISVQCCYHIDIATVANFSFLKAGGNWWLVGCIFD